MIKQIYIRGYDKNFSYFVSDGKGKDIAIVDPGDTDHLIAEINVGGLKPKMILVTHSHFDHIEGVGALVKKYGIPVYMHSNAKGRVEAPEELIHYLEDGDEIEIGDLKLKALYTPGHIDDAICYYIDKEQAVDGVPKVLTGDTLFVEGCGRADFPESNVEDLYESLNRLKELPDETEVYSGHDYGSKPVSTIGWEKEYNKYFLAQDFEEFRNRRVSK